MGRNYTLSFGTDAVVPPLPPGTVRIIVTGDVSITTNTDNIGTLVQGYYSDPNTSMLLTSADNVYEQADPSDFDKCTLTPFVLRNGAQWVYPGTGHHEWGDSGVGGLTSTIHTPADGLAVWMDGIQTGMVYGKNLWYYYHDLAVAKWRVIHLSGTTEKGSHVITGAGLPLVPNTTGTTMNTWFGNRLDEAVNLNYCVLVLWSDPYYGTLDDHHDDEPLMKPFWDLLFSKVPNQALVINGHKHNYERFKKMNNVGVVDTTNGIPSIVAGIGGNGHYGFLAPTPDTGSAFQDDTHTGVLELTLSDQAVTSKFIATDGTTPESFTWALTGGTVTGGIIWGSSPNNSTPITKTLLEPNLIRSYQQSQMAGCAPIPSLYSEKAGVVFATRDLTAGSAYLAKRATLRTQMASVPDTPNQWVAINHEPENDGGADAAWNNSATGDPRLWAQAQVNFKNDVLDFVNNDPNNPRTHPLLFTAILIGGSFNDPAHRDLYFSLACRNAIDAIGSDPYGSLATQDTIDYCATVNKDYGFPEIGDQTGPGHTDAHVLGVMQAEVANIKNAARPAKFVLWFNAVHNTLVTKINTAVTPTSATVSIAESDVPTGAIFTFEPNTVREENITMGSPSNNGGPGVTVIYDFPNAPRFSHAAGTAIILRPRSYAYWHTQDLA